MKRQSRAGLLATLALLAVRSSLGQVVPPKGESTTFDVATWNIEWFGGSASGQGPGDEDLQLANVKAVIEQSEIDLWALQEISDDVRFDLLLSQLGAGYGGYLATNSGQQRIAFVYDKDVVSLRTVGHVLESFSEAFALRPPLEIEVDIELGDTTVIAKLITVHMKAFSDDDSYERRVAASQALKNHIDFTLRDNDPVIILGDFNDLIEGSITFGRESPYKRFVDDPDDFRFATQSLHDEGKATFCFNFNCSSGSTIDHILITNELFDNVLSRSADHFDELPSVITSYTATTSDHLPVFVRFEFPTPTNTDEATSPPARSLLTATYPNPFAEKLTIEYDLQTRTDVSIELVDLLGRLLKRLEYSQHPAGQHKIELSGAGLASGMYFVRIGDGSSTLIRTVFRGQ